MAATPQPASEPPVPEARLYGAGAVSPRAMTGCACAEVPFAEVAQAIAAERLTREQAMRRTGCGQTCTACVPDLLRYLARRHVAALPSATAKD